MGAIDKIRRRFQSQRQREATVVPISTSDPENLSVLSASKPDVHIVEITVSKDIHLTVDGLPKAIPEREYLQIVDRLVSHALVELLRQSTSTVQDEFQGKARLSVNEQVYDIRYKLRATRVREALKAYKAAFDEVQYGKASGQYDSELADLAAVHLKGAAWRELVDESEVLTSQLAALTDNSSGLSQKEDGS